MELGRQVEHYYLAQRRLEEEELTEEHGAVIAFEKKYAEAIQEALDGVEKEESEYADRKGYAWNDLRTGLRRLRDRCMTARNKSTKRVDAAAVRLERCKLEVVTQETEQKAEVVTAEVRQGLEDAASLTSSLDGLTVERAAKIAQLVDSALDVAKNAIEAARDAFAKANDNAKNWRPETKRALKDLLAKLDALVLKEEKALNTKSGKFKEVVEGAAGKAMLQDILQEVAARTKELDKVEAVAKPLETAAKFDAAQVKRIKVTKDTSE